MAAIQTYDLKAWAQAPTLSSCVNPTRSQTKTAYEADGTAMSPMSHAFNEYSLIGTCLRLAQSTFQQAMPATLPADIAAPAAPERESFWRRLGATIDDWFYRQQVREREAYFAQAQDIFDLENRIRQYDQRTSL